MSRFSVMPTVSVIVPIYNVAPYIGYTITSVLAQRFTDFELILVDDGSTDASLAACQAFTDPRIRIMRQENRGLAGARNTGIRGARGNIIAFLDGDDLWEPAKLERHMAHLAERPTVGVSFCHSALIDERGRLLGKYQIPPAGTVTPAELLLTNPISNGSTAVVRRQVLDAIAFREDMHGGRLCYFDERFRRAQGVEDLDCWLRIAVLTRWEIACLPEVLTRYRLNSGGLSARGQEMLKSWEMVVEKARTYAPDLIAHYERPARAYLLRYLASRAVWGGEGRLAISLIHEALRVYPSLLGERRRATWLTLLAAYACWVLPRPVYQHLEIAAAQVEKMLRRKRFAHVQLKEAQREGSNKPGRE